MTESTTVTAPGLCARPIPGYSVLSGPFTHLTAERERLSGLHWRHFEARQTSPTLGAEITGIDLTSALSDDAITELRQALHDYKVLFFRNQPLTPDGHIAFARRFGPLETHPFLSANTDQPELVHFEKGGEVAGVENVWHHDVTWREHPSMGAILHALAVPALGGDTLFADMYAAYDALDEPTRTLVDGLDAVHDFTYAFGRNASDDKREQMRTEFPAVRHPVVCTHPVTGRRHLYVNRAFVSRIVGLAPDQSRELLDRLCRQADSPEHQCRFRWTPDAVAFWDNRAVQHYAASDYWPQTRTVERASVVGPRPVR
jgi:taurine dioxygenase